MTKQQRKVFHIEFKRTQQHFYYGSIAAIFDNFKPDEIGVTAETFYYNHNFEFGPYQNEIVIIRFGYLKTKEGGRGKNKS